MKMIRVADLNHGIGGRCLGVEMEGMQVMLALDHDARNTRICKAITNAISYETGELSTDVVEKIKDVDIISYKMVKTGFSRAGTVGHFSNNNCFNLVALEIIKDVFPKAILMEFPYGLIKDNYFEDYVRNIEGLGYDATVSVFEEMKYSGYPIVGKQGFMVATRQIDKVNFMMPNEVYTDAANDIKLDYIYDIPKEYRNVQLTGKKIENVPFYVRDMRTGDFKASKLIHIGINRETYLFDELGIRKITLNEIAQAKGLTGLSDINYRDRSYLYRKIAYSSNVYIVAAIAREIRRQLFGEDDVDSELSVEGDSTAFEQDIENELYPVEKINVDKGFFSVFELKRKHDANDPRIVLDSDFQRENVWNRIRNSELVESVLMGLPLPFFYFNQDKYGRLIVVDGRQRLTALFSYMDNEYSLKGLKILTKYNGLKFSELPPVQAGKIEDYQIQAHIIIPPTPERVKYDIFDRVNRGGVQLNKQEIRNALYQGLSTKLLKRIVDSDFFAKATGNSFENEKRMKDKYIVLRYLALYLYSENKIKDNETGIYLYKGDIDDMLGCTMDAINGMSEDDVDGLYQKVETALSNCYDIMGEDAFRFQRLERRTPINMNLFETLMLIFTDADIADVKNAIKYIIDFIYSDDFRENITSRRDSAPKLEWRIEQAKRIREEISL